MKKRRLIRIFLLTGILASVLNTLIIIILDLTVPDYNSMTQYVSEFGILPGIVSRIISVWWIISGIALMLFSLSLNNTLIKSARLSFLGPVFIFLYGLLDSIGSVVFPMDVAEETFIGMMHMLVSFIGITAVIFSPVALVGRMKRDHAWGGYVCYTWFTQIYFLLVYVVCIIAFTNIYFNQYLGILQRIFIYSIDIWIIILGIKAFRLSKVLP